MTPTGDGGASSAQVYYTNCFGVVRRPTGSTDPISRGAGQWLQLRLLDMRSGESDMDDYEYYE